MSKHKAKATKTAKGQGKKDKPTSVRLDSSALAKLNEVQANTHRSKNFLIRYAMLKFLVDYEKEGLRDDVLAKLA